MKEFEEREKRKKEEKESNKGGDSKKEERTGPWVGEESRDSCRSSGSGSKRKEEGAPRVSSNGEEK
eukprot:2242735-Karenia_brevis.AAC.1